MNEKRANGTHKMNERADGRQYKTGSKDGSTAVTMPLPGADG